MKPKVYVPPFSEELAEDSLVLSNKIMVIGLMQNRIENMSRLLNVSDSKSQLNLLTNRFDLLRMKSQNYTSHVRQLNCFSMDETAFEHQEVLRL